MNDEKLTQSQEPYRRKMQIMRFVIHLIMLVIVFVMPEVLFSIGRTMPKFVYVHTLGYILVFYVNYYLFIDKFLFRSNRVWLYFLTNLLFVVCYLILIFGVHHYWFLPEPVEIGRRMPPPGPELERRELIDAFQFFSRDFGMMLLSICISLALKFSEKWLKWERYEQKMLAERKEIELKNLKNQLNPHFLFNTLNNIYALIGISQERAQYAVHELSQLLRYVLYENGKTVPLDKEMLFIKSYIELMRLRLNSFVSLKVDINEKSGCGLQIAPLMFISLVENAFKHGISANQKSVIDISIRIVGGSNVVCCVDNSYFPKDDNDHSGSGIGIANLRKQLSILYGGRYSLTQKVEDGFYKTRLEIKLQENTLKTT